MAYGALTELLNTILFLLSLSKLLKRYNHEQNLKTTVFSATRKKHQVPFTDFQLGSNTS